MIIIMIIFSSTIRKKGKKHPMPRRVVGRLNTGDLACFEERMDDRFETNSKAETDAERATVAAAPAMATGSEDGGKVGARAEPSDDDDDDDDEPLVATQEYVPSHEAPTGTPEAPAGLLRSDTMPYQGFFFFFFFWRSLRP